MNLYRNLCLPHLSSLECRTWLSELLHQNEPSLQMHCSTRVRLMLVLDPDLSVIFLFPFFSGLQTVSSVSTNHRENFHSESTGKFLYCCAGTGRLDFGSNRERAVLFHPC